MLAAMVLIVFNVVFWTLFEQAGSSLTLFADRNTDLSVFGLFTITAGQTQFFNPVFIVILAPSVQHHVDLAREARTGADDADQVRDRAGGRRHRLPGPGLGFEIRRTPISRWAMCWLAGLYLIHSIGEFCLSPVGLSMITKLSSCGWSG